MPTVFCCVADDACRRIISRPFVPAPLFFSLLLPLLLLPHVCFKTLLVLSAISPVVLGMRAPLLLLTMMLTLVRWLLPMLSLGLVVVGWTFRRSSRYRLHPAALMLELPRPSPPLGGLPRETDERRHVEHHGDQGGLVLGPRQVEHGGRLRRPAAGLRKRDESDLVAHVRVGSAYHGQSLANVRLRGEETRSVKGISNVSERVRATGGDGGGGNGDGESGL